MAPRHRLDGARDGHGGAQDAEGDGDADDERGHPLEVVVDEVEEVHEGGLHLLDDWHQHLVLESALESLGLVCHVVVADLVDLLHGAGGVGGGTEDAEHRLHSVSAHVLPHRAEQRHAVGVLEELAVLGEQGLDGLDGRLPRCLAALGDPRLHLVGAKADVGVGLGGRLAHVDRADRELFDGVAGLVGAVKERLGADGHGVEHILGGEAQLLVVDRVLGHGVQPLAVGVQALLAAGGEHIVGRLAVVTELGHELVGRLDRLVDVDVEGVAQDDGLGGQLLEALGAEVVAQHRHHLAARVCDVLQAVAVVASVDALQRVLKLAELLGRVASEGGLDLARGRVGLDHEPFHGLGRGVDGGLAEVGEHGARRQLLDGVLAVERRVCHVVQRAGQFVAGPLGLGEPPPAVVEGRIGLAQGRLQILGLVGRPAVLDDRSLVLIGEAGHLVLLLVDGRVQLAKRALGPLPCLALAVQGFAHGLDLAAHPLLGGAGGGDLVGVALRLLGVLPPDLAGLLQLAVQGLDLLREGRVLLHEKIVLLGESLDALTGVGHLGLVQLQLAAKGVHGVASLLDGRAEFLGICAELDLGLVLLGHRSPPFPFHLVLLLALEPTPVDGVALGDGEEKRKVGVPEDVLRHAADEHEGRVPVFDVSHLVLGYLDLRRLDAPL